MMAKQPLGKTLLRNVIRHTGAHNKIQEEMEMWKTRNWEVHTSHDKHFPDTKSVRGQMHCDRVSDQPTDLSRSRERLSEHDDREARYWSRQLYEFKASDPDRWGHSGFKELYPEEFESDSEKSRATRKVRCHKRKKSKSETEASLSKRSKKSSRKKKKKKKKKDEAERRKCSSSDGSSDDSRATKDEQQRKKPKSRHKNKKTEKNRARDVDGNSSGSNSEEERERRTRRYKKRKQDSL
ncbi:NKAP domain containing 1 [Pseudoliparis swirei]|uniref:NKAP domain containing 1 n=1 Tax=Pseudoliparis swirei TaxID=2059687 RepID=UPI0024BDB5F0|nr:NKAP domain containing 1 [Pseudoliparis swirei]